MDAVERADLRRLLDRPLALASAARDSAGAARDRTLRVLRIRDDDADQPPVLVVEDMPSSDSGAAA